jgi:nitrile hydratase subunit beta
MSDSNPLRGHHDMGGQPAGPVQYNEHDYALWEKRIDAMLVLLAGTDRRLMTVDELRKNIEAIGSDAYDKMSYYERWIHSIAQTLIQRGVISVEELGRKMADVEARHAKDEF